MLNHLYIKNYALIETLDIDFYQGFSVITGETGAGKSILLGAISLLLGERADIKSIRQGETRCTIEASFNTEGMDLTDLFDEMDIEHEDDECIIRRELTATGKSRAFINDTPATITQLRVLGERLIDIHSQHQNLLLSKEDFQLTVLDTLAHDNKEKVAYQQTFQEYTLTARRLDELKEEARKMKEEEDYLSFQFQQLEEAKITEGEEEELEQEQQMLEHAEEIKRSLYGAVSCLDSEQGGVLTALRHAQTQMNSILSVYPKAEELAERIESCRIELKDVCEELESSAESVEYNPERQQFVTDRLNLLYELEHKHHVNTVDELLALQKELSQKLQGIAGSDEQIEELTKKLAQLQGELKKRADALTKKRASAAKTLEKAMVETLTPLGMPNIKFVVNLTLHDKPTAQGQDKVTFLFSANKNGTPQPLKQVASGGETARVMLSLKALISHATQLPTIIFDEIDTGVSGQIAERMALIMKQMGEQEHRQVISITHLPQIASMGHHHYRVYKEDSDDATNSHITEVAGEQRVEEIAHMLSGAKLTEAALSNARELLSIG